MKHKLLLPFFILIFSNYCYAQLVDTVKNPAEDYVKSFETDSLLQNPSMPIYVK